ncbi:hypothetical protein RND81_05G166000 [Saponaria officinalis]|uniref:Uncharacterized protein n=1 Tax=Saponaria officinalis TaxID=3572 RepID=A0AAW1KXY7_SAPOF
MKMENTHMTHGTGEDSYARTSVIQADSISKAIPVVKEALEGVYSKMTPKCVMVAELGCASGPNALMLLPEIIDITYKTYMINKSKYRPEIHMFLNDLPTNDFNTISASLPTVHEELNKLRDGDLGPYFISATPGSYYKRLFPTDFLHFVHSANSAHWLSQVPKRLIKENGEYINKGNVYIAETSPPEVIEAYREQYKEDLTTFLKCRGQEIVKGGGMVLNIMATTESHKPHHYFMEAAINTALKDMASQGLIEQEKLDSLDIPFYPPTEEEVRRYVESEGSFHVEEIKNFTLDWDVPTTKDLENNGHKSKGGTEMDVYERAKYATAPIKSGTECIIASHFGDHIINELYSRVTNIVAKRLSCGKLETFHHAISLIKK